MSLNTFTSSSNSGFRHCPNGFLHEYVQYTQYQESPADFHLWVGIGLVASTLGRNVWYDRRYFKIYPNLFITLVAESGKLHKSTALTMGTNLLQETFPNHRFFAEKITPEAFHGYLSKLSKECGSAVATIKASEFAVFFGKSVQDPTLLQLLTDYYDCPDMRTYETKARGLEVASNICVNMLAGSTPEWIRTSLPEDSVGGGFTSRLMMVFRKETEKEGSAFPEFSGTNKDIITNKERCIADLKNISRLRGTFRISSGARDYFEDWYAQHSVDKAPPGMRGFYSRKGDYMFKIAMVASVTRDDQLIITEEDLEFARSMIVHNEGPMEEVLREINKTEYGRLLGKVRDYIKARDYVRRSALLKAFSHSISQEDLNRILSTLMATEEVTLSVNPEDPGSGEKVYSYVKETK